MTLTVREIETIHTFFQGGLVEILDGGGLKRIVRWRDGSSSVFRQVRHSGCYELQKFIGGAMPELISLQPVSLLRPWTANNFESVRATFRPSVRLTPMHPGPPHFKILTEPTVSPSPASDTVASFQH